MKISKRIECIEPSLTRQLFNKALLYNDVINLTLGDPDLLPPLNVRNAACKAIKDGKTRYSANAGLLSVRQSVVYNFKKEYGLYASEDNVIMTVGGMEGLYLAISCLVEKGDEVIIPAPYYVNYVQMVQMNGGIPVLINGEEKTNFSIDLKKVEESISERTIAIIINSPCNPTGAILDSKCLNGIADIAKKHDLLVISDEVYRSLIYDDKKHKSILSIKGMQERTLLIDSLSKKFSMTGYRCGYALGPTELISNMTKMQENVAACAPLPSQYAAIEAYSDNTDTEYILQEFEKRRNILYDGISKIDKLSCIKPQGTFYLFVNISKTGLKSLDFANKLLEQQHVAIVPGVSYGDYDDYVRIAFTLDESKLIESVQRINKFVNSL